jgi:hypothetical protein
MYDDIRLHYGPAVTSQLFWLAPLSDEILDVVTSKTFIKQVKEIKWLSIGHTLHKKRKMQ